MTESEYRVLDAINWSTLKHARACPHKDTARLALGRAVHALAEVTV